MIHEQAIWRMLMLLADVLPLFGFGSLQTAFYCSVRSALR